jgi:hypothetical protein
MGQNVSSDEESIEEISWMEDSERDDSEDLSDCVSNTSSGCEKGEDHDSIHTKETEEKPLSNLKRPLLCRKKSLTPVDPDRKLPSPSQCGESLDSVPSTVNEEKEHQKKIDGEQADVHDGQCTPKNLQLPSSKLLPQHFSETRTPTVLTPTTESISDPNKCLLSPRTQS